MGTNECSQPASKSSWDSQDFGDVNMVLKMAHFHKSSRPQWVKSPRSGVNLCFQFVSAASTASTAPATTDTFASHVKTVCAKPCILESKNIWIWGNALDDFSMSLTQGHDSDID